ncbi:uncharacterized protein LOC126272664 [Schistocerca gregaria]|uniref:uncharacterized protein LOC126272664 n=1 Tax=Schistocerca gregaria TaxID=7010 RepID=UPI00211E0676|nr:uncharacterized protein LOC126272664 [Schistocerca gregaria]
MVGHHRTRKSTAVWAAGGPGAARDTPVRAASWSGEPAADVCAPRVDAPSGAATARPRFDHLPQERLPSPLLKTPVFRTVLLRLRNRRYTSPWCGLVTAELAVPFH